MDGNGNNNSKVSTLRQHFENYDRIEQPRRGSAVSATSGFPVSNSSGVSVSSGGKLVDRGKGSGGGSGVTDAKSFAFGLAEKVHQARGLARSTSEKDLLMSVSVAPEGAGTRNGIYVSNSKRRGLVILDDEDGVVVPVHHSAREMVDDEDFIVDEDEMEEDDELDEDVDDAENEDGPTVEALHSGYCIPLAFDRHDEVHGDGLSIASNSTTSSHHSYHSGSYGHLLKNQNSGRVDGDNKNEKASVLTGNHNNNNNNNNTGVGGPRESGSKANTPTSSSSCSSGSGGCGKVKRRNAFRHKDVSSFPTSTAAGDGSSSAILAAVAKTKVAVERVKSLDSATTNTTSSAAHSITPTASHPSTVKPTAANLSSAILNSSRKSVSGRGGDSASEIPSPVPKKMDKERGNGSLVGGGGLPCSSESCKKSSECDKGSLRGSNPHERPSQNSNNSNCTSTSNNGSKGSPAQRATSLRVRATSDNKNMSSSSSPNKSPLRSSQLYEQCVNSAFARNNGSGTRNNHPSHSHYQHYQLHQLQNSGGNNNTPDNLSNNSINSSSNNNNNGSSQRVVNVVTPYQVTDIYNQLKISESSAYSHPNATNNNSNNSNKKNSQQLKQMLNEVEYAVPMIPNQHPELHVQQHKVDHSPQTSSPSEIPPKVPPPPLNYPPSSVRKEQFGLPSPNSSYTFLPHRKSTQQGMLPSFMPSTTKTSSNDNANTKKSDKSAKVPSGPPEKPPRTFLYNQAQKSRGSPGSVGLPPSSSSQAKRQHSSSSSSSTLTSGTAATIVHNYRQQLSPPSLSVSTATVRQTNTAASLNQSAEPIYTPSRNKRREEDVSTKVNSSADNRRPSKNSSAATVVHSSKSSHNSSGPTKHNHHHHHHHHHHNHPPLVRSKTESQLVVKSKSSVNRYLNRPSDAGLGYGVEMMSLEPGRRNHSHFHQDLLAENPTTAFAHANSGMPSLSSYYASNSPPVHHQSQTNLIALASSNKIYGQQQYRSINNLVRHSNNGAGNDPGMNPNKYPSNPGLHYATRELSWMDNGLPPVTIANAGSSYNIYYGTTGDNHQSNQSTRQNNSVLYATNIDISSYSDQGTHGEGRSQEKQQHSLYGMKPSDNLSVQHQLRSSSQFSSPQVHHPLYQYRFSEKSKSEWALNVVQCASANGSGSWGSSGLNNYRAGGSNASDNSSHGNSPAVLSQRQHNQHVSGRNGSIDSSKDSPSPLLPHMMNRRATVAIAGSASANDPGHPSLDSSVSSPNHHFSNSPLSSIQHNSVKGHNRHHHGGAPSSIQHLVNQLFSSTTIKDATSSTDSGIQLGSESLSSCDTPIGDSTTDTGDSDCENEGDTSNSARKVVEARKGYVRRVSSVRVQELGESLHRLIQSSKVVHNIDPLFECLLVVGLDRDPSNGIYHPYIREKFPRDAKLAEGVEQFCFPDSLEWPCHEGSTAQFYTLAITDQRGGRKFGCCFRILPEGASFCIPITYCIISSHRSIGFYREVLKEITACHGHSEFQRRHFLQELYKKSFPAPGSSISVTEPTLEETYVQSDHVGYGSLTGSPPKTVTIRRRADHRLDEIDLVTLVSTVDLSIVIKVFGSLLLERKVVILSRALSTLSLCIEALESLLYPFNWQHTFVPILPLDMTDVIDAPAPFLIGVLRSSRTAWDKTLDDGIVVDLDVDNGKIISCVGDEGTILPKRIHRKLRNALSQLVIDLADQKESTKNVLISECFIRMFVETLGHYSNHIVTKPDGTRAFERDSFVKSSESKATQNFLEWFSETSMFNEFIELKLKNPNQHGLFEQRVMEQSESGPLVHASGNGTPLKKDIWVKMKGPFGTWLKETFKQ